MPVLRTWRHSSFEAYGSLTNPGGGLMQTLYRNRTLRLSDQDLNRITFWVGLVSVTAFAFACAAVIWDIMAAGSAA